MLTAVLGVMSAATGAWLVSYIIDVAELLPDEDGDMLREAIPTAHREQTPWLPSCSALSLILPAVRGPRLAGAGCRQGKLLHGLHSDIRSQ